MEIERAGSDVALPGRLRRRHGANLQIREVAYIDNGVPVADHQPTTVQLALWINEGRSTLLLMQAGRA
jgi:hypothetical protein